MPVERNIREILTGQAALNEADQTKRLEMLVRQGLMSQAKLPILRRGLDKLKGGKALAPNERDAVNTLMNSFMYIVLGDDTVFTRAKMHTQKTKYQAEDSDPNCENENCSCEVCGCVDCQCEALSDDDNYVGEEDLTEKLKEHPMVDIVSKILSEKGTVKIDDSEPVKQPETEEPTAKHPAETSTRGDTSPPKQGDSDAKDREHMCVSKVFKKELGEGTCIPGEHADPDENGHVEWYKVMFESGIWHVDIKDVEVLEEEVHKHKSKKVAEDYDTPAKKKPVSQMTPAEKKANDERRNAYNEFQKKKIKLKGFGDGEKSNMGNPAARASLMKSKNEEVEIEEEGAMSKDKAGHTTGGFRISNKEADAAKKRLTKKAVKKQVQAAAARVDEPLKMQLQRQGKLKEDISDPDYVISTASAIDERSVGGGEFARPRSKSEAEIRKHKADRRAKRAATPNKVYSEEEELEIVSESYKTGHKSYTDAVNHAIDHHKKGGLESSADDKAQHIGLDSKKPGKDKTTRVNLPAKDKTGKKHMVHMQIYNKGGSHPYELNTYSSTTKALQKEGAFKRMATDAEEERLAAERKAIRKSKKAADKEKETDPGIKEATAKKKPLEPTAATKKAGDAAHIPHRELQKGVRAGFPSKHNRHHPSWKSEPGKPKPDLNKPRRGSYSLLDKDLDGLQKHVHKKMKSRLAFNKKRGMGYAHAGMEEETVKEDYKKKFEAMLKKTGKSLNDMSDEEKKAFFNKVDTSHDAKNEGNLIDFNDFDLKEYITSKQVKMAKGIAFDKRHKGGDMTGAAKKMEKIKKGLSNHPGAQKALRQANEDTDLEEGAIEDARRDAKRDSKGLASTKKDRPDMKHDAKKDSGPEHIVPQLRKAVSIGKHVTFKDGKSHRITQAHASKFLNKYLSSKPADKEKMQDHAHQSHNHFMKHV